MAYVPHDDDIADAIRVQATDNAQFAIAHALLKLTEAVGGLARAVEVVIGAELAGIGISIREHL